MPPSLETMSLKRDHKERNFLGMVFTEDALNQCILQSLQAHQLSAFFPEGVGLWAFPCQQRLKEAACPSRRPPLLGHAQTSAAELSNGEQGEVLLCEARVVSRSCSTVHSPGSRVVCSQIQFRQNPSLVSSQVDLVLLDVTESQDTGLSGWQCLCSLVCPLRTTNFCRS